MGKYAPIEHEGYTGMGQVDAKRKRRLEEREKSDERKEAAKTAAAEARKREESLTAERIQSYINENALLVLENGELDLSVVEFIKAKMLDEEDMSAIGEMAKDVSHALAILTEENHLRGQIEKDLGMSIRDYTSGTDLSLGEAIANNGKDMLKDKVLALLVKDYEDIQAEKVGIIVKYQSKFGVAPVEKKGALGSKVTYYGQSEPERLGTKF